MEIEKAAIAYFNAATHTVREKTVQCLEKAEKVLGENLTVGRFRNFLTVHGKFDIPDSLLKDLNLGPSDPLRFKEFLVMMYVAKTWKHSCENCNAFLTGIFFTCLICFDEEKKTHNLCIDCFGKKRTCSLNHAVFRDNFTLLYSKSNQAKEAAHLLKSEKEKGSIPESDEEQGLLNTINEVGTLYSKHEFTHEQFRKGRRLFWEKFHGKAELECSIM